jgi:transcriptional regulator with XRE-family HTH domain
VTSNIASGRQIRAARVLAGLTQAELAKATGHHVRAVRYWEGKEDAEPTCVPITLERIEEAFLRHGVRLFLTPTPGIRLVSPSSSI